MKALWVLAGANGVGKTTFYELFLGRFAIPFVNADDIARTLDGTDQTDLAYRAAGLASEERARRLRAGTSFVTETVFSHESKLALLNDARSHGFFIWMIYIGVASVEISVERIQRRVILGGHDVPADKVLARTARSFSNLQKAVPLVDRLDLYDNTDILHAFRRLCRWESGGLVWRVVALPDWAELLVDPKGQPS